MGRATPGMIVAMLLVACTAASSPDPTASEPAPEPSIAEPSVSAEPSPSPTPTPAPSMAPRALFGTWRTTLGGDSLSLNITETSYRIVRGPSSATGSVTVTDDRIEFFDSNLCAGTGVYRWAISDAGSLSFSPLETEPCDGRLEALLVRYPDYSPPPEAGAAPPELAGLWSRPYVAGETLYMTLDRTRYTVTSGPGGSVTGRIFVDGDRIVFSDAEVCEGSGVYTWSVEADRLRLTLAGADPCNRVGFLPDADWERR